MLQDANGNWQAQFTPSMEGVVTAQAEMWEGMGLGLGAQFDVSNLFAEAWFDDYTLTFAQEVNSTTLETLGNMFQQAQAEGWQIREMESNLETMFGQWMTGNKTSDDFEWYAERMPLWRREMIARTETMRSSNTGTFNLFEFWQVPMKEWNAVIDKRTRPGHAKAGFDYVDGGDIGPIPMSQPFVIQGVNGSPVTLMHPQAIGAPIEEVVNCRCSSFPFFPEWSEQPEGLLIEEDAAFPTIASRLVPESEQAVVAEMSEAQSARDAMIAAGNQFEADGIQTYIDALAESLQQEQRVNSALWEHLQIMPGQATVEDWRNLADSVEREGFNLYRQYTKEGIKLVVEERRGAQLGGYASVGSDIVQIREGQFSVRAAQRMQGEMWAAAKDDLTVFQGDFLEQLGYTQRDIAKASFEQRMRLMAEVGEKQAARTGRGAISKIDDVDEILREAIIDAVDYDLAAVSGHSAQDILNLPTIDAWGKMELADMIRATRG